MLQIKWLFNFKNSTVSIEKYNKTSAHIIIIIITKIIIAVVTSAS